MAAFTKVIPVPRPLVPKTTLNYNTPGVKYWLAGFVSGFPKLLWNQTH